MKNKTKIQVVSKEVLEKNLRGELSTAPVADSASKPIVGGFAIP